MDNSETLTLAQEAAALHELRKEQAEAKDTHDDLKLKADEAELRLFARMEHEEAQSFRHASLGVNFVRAETTYGQVQDRSVFVEWAEKQSPELLETKERKALINELVREHLDDGKPLPPGLGFHVKQYVSQRAG